MKCRTTACALAIANLLMASCDYRVQLGPRDDDSFDAGSAVAARDAGCSARTCASSCGAIADGCGATLQCSCGAGLECSDVNLCRVPLCENQVRDPGELDIDCGGFCANRCPVGRRCAQQSDCANGSTCDDLVCQPGTWSVKTPMPTARLQPAAVVDANGHLWVLGGFGNSGATAVVEVYDVANDTWSVGPSMGSARYRHSTVIGVDGRLYVFGGQYDDSHSPFVDGLSKTAEVYDFGTQSWSALPDLPDGRMGATAAVLPNGEIMLSGGLSVAPVTILAKAAVYAPVTSTWRTATTSMLTGRSSHGQVVLGEGRILVAGGFPPAGNNTSRTASAEIFDSVVGTWASAPPMPDANGDMAGARVGGTAYFFGGNAGHGDLHTVVTYEVAARTWSTAASSPSLRRGSVALPVADGRVFVIGGAESSGFSEMPSARVEVFTP